MDDSHGIVLACVTVVACDDVADLSFFQGALPSPPGGFSAAEQLQLRALVPQNRKKVY